MICQTYFFAMNDYFNSLSPVRIRNSYPLKEPIGVLAAPTITMSLARVLAVVENLRWIIPFIILSIMYTDNGRALYHKKV